MIILAASGDGRKHIGTAVRKYVKGFGWFNGTVDDQNNEIYHSVDYPETERNDPGAEDMSEDDFTLSSKFGKLDPAPTAPPELINPDTG